jgi:integrase/recombinase XerC
MASATIYARTDRSSGSEIPVYLRLTHKGERARMSLDLKLSARHWNGNKGRVRSSHPQSEYLNQYLSDVQATADGAIARLKSQGVVPSASRLKQEVQSELAGETGGDDFLEFCEKQLEGYRQRGQEGTFRNYRSVIRKFEEFWRSERSGTCRPSDLTVSLIEDWRTWLYSEKGNAQNTVAKALSVFRTFYRQGQKEEVIPRDEYIWDHITIEREETEKELPTAAEMKTLIDLWEEWIDDLSAHPSPNKWRALAYFLTAYYAGGMRFQDVAHLRWDHISGWPGPGARIKYKMGKTGDVTALPVVPALRDIFEIFDDRREEHDRVFPIMDGRDISTEAKEFEARNRANGLANKYLRQIADQLDISHLSFHMSRNLSAWQYYQNTGDIYQVMQMMGHASVDQTRDYLRGFGADIDDSFRDTFG